MLTSSDAKWRCMWHMFVWSILLTLVSQFLELQDHIAFYFFAGISILVLPVLTAIYSNTSGKHCAELLRVGYVFCDPVLASLTISPVLLLNRLPKIVDQFFCLTHFEELGLNETIACLENSSHADQLEKMKKMLADKPHELVKIKQGELLVMEGCIVVPIILFLLMGRKTRKMKCSTFLLVFIYWFVAALEACALMETSLLRESYKHVVYTTMAIISIVMIVTNSYAVVTLCSYISPGQSSTNKLYQRKFDFLYKTFVGVAGVLFAEVPLMIARFQIIFADEEYQVFLPGTFYLWLIKDMLSCCLLLCLVYTQKFTKKTKFMPCRPSFVFDSKDVFFQPEKRDVYIQRQKKGIGAPPTAVLTSENLTTRKLSAEKLKANRENRSAEQSKGSYDTATVKAVSSASMPEPEKVEDASKMQSVPRGGARQKTSGSAPVKKGHKGKDKEKTKTKHVTFKFDMGLGRGSAENFS